MPIGDGDLRPVLHGELIEMRLTLEKGRAMRPHGTNAISGERENPDGLTGARQYINAFMTIFVG